LTQYGRIARAIRPDCVNVRDKRHGALRAATPLIAVVCGIERDKSRRRKQP
jgi:hypothetical protein